MELNQAIFERKSIRSFQDKPVEEDKIKELIKAAIYAPSASNKQAWKFIVIDDKDMKEAICMQNGGITKNGGTDLIQKAPTGILVLYRNDVSRNYKLYKDTIQSRSAAIQNMLLKAHEVGLGACWMCKLPHPGYLRKLLDIPKYYDVIAYVVLGYPKEYLAEHTLWHYQGDAAGALERKRRYSIEDVACHNRFVGHNNQKGVLKHPNILYRLHAIQLNIKTNGKSTLLEKLMKPLFKLFDGTYT